MFSGHPILDEIKKGFKLRPTKTVDKSKPIIYAEGEDESEVAPTKRAPPSGILPPGQAVTPTPSFIPPVSMPPIPMAPVPFVVGADGIPPPPPMFGMPGSGAPPPPPPPPPMGGIAPPPPPPIARPKTPLNPKLAKLGGKTPGTVDRGEFLKGIQGGFKLKKAVTNDKSGLYVDDEMREKSVTLVEAAPSTYIPPPSRQSIRPHSSLGFESDDDRFRTTRTPEPRDDSPEQLIGQRRPIVMRFKGDPLPPPPEFGFDSEKQKITSEDIEKEIKKGSVASKMAALMGNMGYSQDKIDQVGTGTLPRTTFRRSPLRSSMMSTSSEVNNNHNRNEEDDGTPKPKPVSKWHVDTNYGLRTASRSNVPIEKQERATSVMKERSSSWLDLSRNNNLERARTQSPIPLCERLELDDIDIDHLEDYLDPKSIAEINGELAPKPKKKTSTTTRKKSKHLPDPITVNTDFCTTGSRRSSKASQQPPPPQIQETPPTPAQKKTYGYMGSASKSTNTTTTTPSYQNRPSSPINSSGMSPNSSSMSSASAPSPSSLSAGSVSPDQTPKKRGSISFERAKEKWGAAVKAEVDQPASTRFYGSVRDSKTPTREEMTPTKEMTPQPTSLPPKKVGKETKERSPPCFAVTTAEAKGATAVAKAKSARKKSLKNGSTLSTNTNKSPSPPAPSTKTTTTTTNTTSTTITPTTTNDRRESVTKKSWGQPESGTVADRANKFKQQLQADEDKGKKPWQKGTTKNY